MKPPTERSVNGKRGKQRQMCSAEIQMPEKHFGLIF